MRSRKQDNLVRKQLRLEQCAWANRRVMTPSELRLWSALSARKLGVQFRREVPLGGATSLIFARLQCASWSRSMVRVTPCVRRRMRAAIRSCAGSGIACCGWTLS